MTIQLSADGEQIVRSLIAEGRFGSEAEVIDEALRLLQQHDEAARLAELRRDIAVGLDQADRGELAPFDPRATLERIMQDESDS